MYFTVVVKTQLLGASRTYRIENTKHLLVPEALLLGCTDALVLYHSGMYLD